MKLMLNAAAFLLAVFLLSSCVSKKKFSSMQTEYQDQLATTNEELGKCGEDLNEYMRKLRACESKMTTTDNTLRLREEQINDLRVQVEDYRKLRDRQVEQVGDLTVLSQSANENIKETLSQLERKDKYINLLREAKTKADSINLALAVNLKSVLQDGIADSDIEVKVDKTVVFINLSDKMLYQSGSAKLTSRANEVLQKIATIIESRPGLEVMVEGYTDNVPIKNECIEDNWDLSVKRSTAVVRALQTQYKVDPNRLIAAGRGQFNTLADNSTAEGRSMNRRTRIIIMPKLNQFYDLLNPSEVPE